MIVRKPSSEDARRQLVRAPCRLRWECWSNASITQTHMVLQDWLHWLQTPGAQALAKSRGWL